MPIIVIFFVHLRLQMYFPPWSWYSTKGKLKKRNHVRVKDEALIWLGLVKPCNTEEAHIDLLNTYDAGLMLG